MVDKAGDLVLRKGFTLTKQGLNRGLLRMVIGFMAITPAAQKHYEF